LAPIIGTALGGIGPQPVDPNAPQGVPQAVPQNPEPDNRDTNRDNATHDAQAAADLARQHQQDAFGERASATGRPLAWFSQGLPTHDGTSTPGYRELLELAQKKVSLGSTPRQVTERASIRDRRLAEQRAPASVPSTENHLAQVALQRMLERVPAMGQALPLTAYSAEEPKPGTLPDEAAAEALASPFVGQEPPVEPHTPTLPRAPVLLPQQGQPLVPPNPLPLLQPSLQPTVAMTPALEQALPAEPPSESAPHEGGSQGAAREHESFPAASLGSLAKLLTWSAPRGATPSPAPGQPLVPQSENPLAQASVQRMLQTMPAAAPLRRVARTEAAEHKPTTDSADEATEGESVAADSEEGFARFRMMGTLARLSVRC
jgi:hypothetical protein